MRLPDLLNRYGLMRTRHLFYFYAKRLRIHAAQELFALVGVAVGVALAFAVTVAAGSVTSSASAVVHTVIGPADLQLRARGPEGFEERLLPSVERLPGVARAVPLLEQTASIAGPRGRPVTVTIAGAGVRLAVMDGLSRTLPAGVLAVEGIGLSSASAKRLGIPSSGAGSSAVVTVDLRGQAHRLAISAVLGREAAGALSQAQVAVMPLARLQQLAGLEDRVSRILVQSRPGHALTVRRELLALADGRLTVAAADQDVSLLRQALRPSNQASDLFAGLSALLGFLLAFNATLLTVPERREAIADLRLDGATRPAIVQMVLFQAVCLGIVASMLGLLGGYALALGLFHQSPGYLTTAFTLGTNTVLGARPILVSLTGGILATTLAALVPLRDLRGGRPIDAAFGSEDDSGPVALERQRWFATATAGLLLMASALYAFAPAAALLACVLLALATVAAVPLLLAGVLRAGEAIARHRPRVTVLPLALCSLRTTTLRSLALAATGAVALFGSVALGSSRGDLLRGIDAYTAHYVASAGIWLVNPNDNQATREFAAADTASRIARLAGVASVQTFQGSLLDLGDRRVWVIALPARASRLELLDGQIVTGAQPSAIAHLRQGGAITVSEQIATEHHTKLGGALALPTPTGTISYRIAATTTNFGWSPGTILMSTRDYARAWASTAPSALGVQLRPGEDPTTVKDEIEHALGPSSGLEVLTASAREAAIEASASEGLAQLQQISALLVAAAILAMAAALGSSIWSRRTSLAEMLLEGASRRQLRLVLLAESALMLSAACLTGAILGVYGQAAIDNYLEHVTGFPVAGMATGQRPLEIVALVLVLVLAIVTVPGWRASRVPAALALNE